MGKRPEQTPHSLYSPIICSSLHFTISSYLASSQTNWKLSFPLPKNTSHHFPFAFFSAATVSALASTRSFFIFWTLQNHSTLEPSQFAGSTLSTKCHSRYVKASKCWKRFCNFPNVIMQVNSREEDFFLKHF